MAFGGEQWFLRQFPRLSRTAGEKILIHRKFCALLIPSRRAASEKRSASGAKILEGVPKYRFWTDEAEYAP